jgi:hypothetical protein
MLYTSDVRCVVALSFVLLIGPFFPMSHWFLIVSFVLNQRDGSCHHGARRKIHVGAKGKEHRRTRKQWRSVCKFPSHSTRSRCCVFNLVFAVFFFVEVVLEAVSILVLVLVLVSGLGLGSLSWVFGFGFGFGFGFVFVFVFVFVLVFAFVFAFSFAFVFVPLPSSRSSSCDLCVEIVFHIHLH